MPENGSPQRGLGGSSSGNLLGIIGIGLLTSWLSNRKNGNNGSFSQTGAEGGVRRRGGSGCLIVLIIVLLEDDIGRKAMTNPNTLSEYIRYCKQRFPADRYELILWDHGGGSVGGYGYDQLFPNGTMTLDKLYTALKGADCAFDFIGFDACLMATLETAIMFEPLADYLIASEETEPGTGWFYTDWLTALSENTSMPTIEIGIRIADDFRAANEQRSPNDMITLSLIDLAELKATVPQAFSAFSQSTTELINTDKYKLVSDAREFAQSVQINQVDLIHLAENMGTPERLAPAKALRGCVKYNTTSRSIATTHGWR